MTYKGKRVCYSCWGAHDYHHDGDCHCDLYIPRPKFLDAEARRILKQIDHRGFESLRYDEPKTAAQIINRKLENKLAEIFNPPLTTPRVILNR